MPHRRYRNYIQLCDNCKNSSLRKSERDCYKRERLSKARARSNIELINSQNRSIKIKRIAKFFIKKIKSIFTIHQKV